MITLRRSEERHYEQRPNREAWLTFYPEDPADPRFDGLAALRTLDEFRLAPGAGVPRRTLNDAEIVTYVLEGALACDDSAGRSGVVQAGEFQHLTIGRGIRHRESNASRTRAARIFQVVLRPCEAELEASHEQKRFSVAQRRGLLRVVVSPDGRRESLRIHQDALMYSALLDRGKHVVHELAPGRSAWLHLVQGEVTLADVVLTTGDGAGFSAEYAVSLTAQEESEILLLDVGE